MAGLDAIKVPPIVFGAVLGIWLVFFMLGKRQFEKTKAYTTDLLVEEYKKAARGGHIPNLDRLYRAVEITWEAWLAQNVRFILNKVELWPVKATPEVVRQRLNMSPEWAGAYLELNGYKVEARPEQAEKIAHIVSLAPQNRKAEDVFPEHPPRKKRGEEADPAK